MKRTLILEMQDGGMSQNSKTTVKQMIDSVVNNIPPNINLIFKWQLYQKIKTYVEIMPLKHEIFEFAHEYAANLGYETTASVFDQESLSYLQQFKVPFIKLACKTNLYDFRKNMWSLDGNYKTVISVENKNDFATMVTSGSLLCCVPKYPAAISEYESEFGELLYYGISDHTVGLDLYNKYKPIIFEKHFYMDGLESWDKNWAIKPEELHKIT